MRRRPSHPTTLIPPSKRGCVCSKSSCRIWLCGNLNTPPPLRPMTRDRSTIAESLSPNWDAGTPRSKTSGAPSVSILVGPAPERIWNCSGRRIRFRAGLRGRISANQMGGSVSSVASQAEGSRCASHWRKKIQTTQSATPPPSAKVAEAGSGTLDAVPPANHE